MTGGSIFKCSNNNTIVYQWILLLIITLIFVYVTLFVVGKGDGKCVVDEGERERAIILNGCSIILWKMDPGITDESSQLDKDVMKGSAVTHIVHLNLRDNSTIA